MSSMMFTPAEKFTLTVGMYTFTGAADEVAIDKFYAGPNGTLEGLMPTHTVISLTIHEDLSKQPVYENLETWEE